MGITSQHWTDEDGNNTGGGAYGPGFAIHWQRGPLGRGEGRKEPNGAFITDVLAACADRLQHHQTTKYACASNAEALAHIGKAIAALDARTADRESRGVEGTSEV